MGYQGDSIDPGTNPTLSVYNDATGSGHVQGIKNIDPTAGSTSPIGVDSNPVRVRQRRRGTSDYDSGSVAVAASSTAITSSTVYLEGGYIVNLTDQVHPVTVTDTNGDEILNAYPLQPHETKDLPVRDEVMYVGLKAFTDVVSAVKLRAWGTT